MQKKVCRHCGRLLPATSFPRRGGRVCRSCYPEVYPRPSWRDTCAARKARQAQNARGPCDQTWPGAESTEVEAEGGEA
jgi:hypothetical protein